ncbi:unnamed protein product [Adineta steineri]|uniref:Uncharacterized protein n=2 Tax=Adineta steineri TaxID=433720 RepID=A0A813N6N4_9BILA|nr:unnamed protein product [Adineta steineri]
MNAAVIEECTTGSNFYINKFDSIKMRCLNRQWRQVFIHLEHHCISNVTTRTWNIRTNTIQSLPWPLKIFILTKNKDQLSLHQFGTLITQQSSLITDSFEQFNPNNNQFISYIWTDLLNGPQCRTQFTVVKDICTRPNKTRLAAEFINLICYYGKTNFILTNEAQRNAFDKFLNNNTTTVDSNIISKTSSTINNLLQNPNLSQDPNLLAAHSKKNTFWEKNKLYIFIGGGIGLVIIILGIIIIIKRHIDLSQKNLERKMSIDSNIE